MPVMLVAYALCGVEAASSTTLRNYNSATLWAISIALTVLAIGLGVNTKHMENEAVLKTDDEKFSLKMLQSDPVV
ncbi:hypothetical protein BDR22DRAFT_968700 [Usnea florida]